jgi:hypothetical protein
MEFLSWSAAKWNTKIISWFDINLSNRMRNLVTVTFCIEPKYPTTLEALSVMADIELLRFDIHPFAQSVRSHQTVSHEDPEKGGSHSKPLNKPI